MYLRLSRQLILFVPVIDLFISKCQVSYCHICWRWLWCLCAIVRTCLCCACVIHSLCGFGSAGICGLINKLKGRPAHTCSPSGVCLCRHGDMHTHTNTQSLRMIDVLHVGPFTLCYHNTYYSRPLLSQHYIICQIKKERKETGWAIERNLLLRNLCWKDKKTEWMLLFPSCFQSESMSDQ